MANLIVHWKLHKFKKYLQKQPHTVSLIWIQSYCNTFFVTISAFHNQEEKGSNKNKHFIKMLSKETRTRGSEMPQKAGCARNIDGQTNRQKMDKRTDGSTPISKATQL